MPAHRYHSDPLARPTYPTGPRVVRVAAGLALITTAIAVWICQQWVRDTEITIAGEWFGALLHGPVTPVADAIYFPWVGGPLIGLQNTWECTVALLIAPLCVVGGALLAFTRMQAMRTLIGLTVALAVIVAVNQLRLAMIAVSLQRWGMTGYDVTHKVIGSLLAVAGFAAAVVIFIKIAAKNRSTSELPVDHAGVE